MKNKLDEHLDAYDGKNQYDFDNKILLNWYSGRVLNNTKEASSILELGLGHGFTTSKFFKNYARHVVLDGSPAVINNFKNNFPACNVEIIETFFEEFSTDEKFDVIVMGFILEHVDNPCDIITRYKDFLSPNGKIFIAVPNSEVLNRRLGYMSGMMESMDQLSENDHLLGHKRYYTVNSLTDEVEKSGFKIDKIEGIYLKPFTTSQMLSLKLDDKIINSLCEIGVDYPELSCGILSQISKN